MDRAVAPEFAVAMLLRAVTYGAILSAAAILSGCVGHRLAHNRVIDAPPSLCEAANKRGEC